MKKRYSTKEFETAIISRNYVIDHIALNDQRQVKKIEGRVPYIVQVIIAGKKTYKRRYKKVRWDAEGKAFRQSDNIRQRDYDLILPS